MAAATSRGPASGQTQTQIPVQGPQTQTQTQAVLHLRGATREEKSTATGRRIQWAEDVVDNEGMGKKKSKGLSSSLYPFSIIVVRFGWAWILTSGSLLHIPRPKRDRRIQRRELIRFKRK